MSKLFKTMLESLLVSVALWIFLFFSLNIICGVEWAFTYIDHNRFMTWLEDDLKHLVQMYYLCLFGGIFISYLINKGKGKECEGK